MLLPQIVCPVLVGRGAELDALTSLLDGAAEGRGSAVLVGGDAGIGTSRLCRELKRLATARGLRVMAVHRLAGDGPLLLVLEDFHWADPTSCDLLHFLARRVPALPLLLVVTSRTEEIPAGHAVRRLLATLVRERIARELRLAPLGRDEVAEMMAAIAGGESISAYSVSRK
ncbi:hypothetical protein BH20GEM2_BH20GEM2_05090 [soil metagenome]